MLEIQISEMFVWDMNFLPFVRWDYYCICETPVENVHFEVFFSFINYNFSSFCYFPCVLTGRTVWRCITEV